MRLKSREGPGRDVEQQFPVICLQHFFKGTSVLAFRLQGHLEVYRRPGGASALEGRRAWLSRDPMMAGREGLPRRKASGDSILGGRPRRQGGG